MPASGHLHTSAVRAQSGRGVGHVTPTSDRHRHRHRHRHRPCSSWVSQTEFVPPFTPPRAFLMEEELGEFISNPNSSSAHLLGEHFPNPPGSPDCQALSSSGRWGPGQPGYRSPEQPHHGWVGASSFPHTLAPLKLPDLSLPRWPELPGATSETSNSAFATTTPIEAR